MFHPKLTHCQHVNPHTLLDLCTFTLQHIYHWDADGPRIAFKGPDGTRRMYLLTHWVRLSEDT